MQKRIASIVTDFKAAGVTAFKKATQAVSDAFGKVGSKFGIVGDKAKAGLDKAKVAALKATTALTRVGAAGARVGVQGALGATRMSGALSRMALQATAVAAAISAIGKASTIAFSKKALEDTIEDLRMLRQTASFLGISPEEASLYTNFAEQSGLARDEFRDAIGAFKEAQAEAVDDPESMYAKIFAKAKIDLNTAKPLDRDGLETIRTLRSEMTDAGDSARDIQDAVAGITRELTRAEGKARPTMAVLNDLATRTAQMGSEERGFLLSQIFGGSDSLKISEFLDRLAVERGDLGRVLDESRRRDLLVTKRQIELAKQVDRSRGSLAIAYRSVQRQVFVQVAPAFILVLNRLTRFFSDSNVQIGNLVSKSLGRMYGLARDVVRVFSGFDLNRWLGGASVDVQNTWLFRVKEVLDGIGASVAAAIRDIRRVRAALSEVDPEKAETIGAGVETRFGRMILVVSQAAVSFTGTVQRAAVKAWTFVGAEFDRLVLAPIKRSFADSKLVFDAGGGVMSAESDLTKLFVALRLAVDYVDRFGRAWKAVFVDGLDAPEGFGFLADLRDGLGQGLKTLGEFGRGFVAIFGPIDAFLRKITGLGLAANLLLLIPILRIGRLVFGLVAGFVRFGGIAIRSLAPVGGALGRIGGGIAAIPRGIVGAIQAIGRMPAYIGRVSRAFGQSGLMGAAGRALAFVGQIVGAFAVVMIAGAKNLVDTGVDLFKQGAGAAFNAFVSGFQTIWNAAFRTISDALEMVGDGIRNLYILVSVYLLRAWDWLRNGVLTPAFVALQTALDLLTSAMSRVRDAVYAAGQTIADFARTVASSVRSAMDEIKPLIALLIGGGGLVVALLAVGKVARTAFGALKGLAAARAAAAAVAASGVGAAGAGAAGAAVGGAAAGGGVRFALGRAGAAVAGSAAAGAGAVGATVLSGAAIGAIIGEAFNRYLLEPYLQSIADVDIQTMIDRDIKPMLESTPSLGRSQSMLDVYNAQNASLDVGTMTAGTIDLSAATVNTPPSNLRPFTVVVNGQQVAEGSADPDQVTRMRRSQGASLGVTL